MTLAGLAWPPLRHICWSVTAASGTLSQSPLLPATALFNSLNLNLNLNLSSIIYCLQPPFTAPVLSALCMNVEQQQLPFRQLWTIFGKLPPKKHAPSRNNLKQLFTQLMLQLWLPYLLKPLEICLLLHQLQIHPIKPKQWLWKSSQKHVIS